MPAVSPRDEEAMGVLKAVKLKSHDLKWVLVEAEFREIIEKVQS